jgi:gluconolactonase
MPSERSVYRDVVRVGHATALSLALVSFLAATLGTAWSAPPQTIGSIERLDPAADRLLPQDAKIEVLADGFEWSEGPVWVGRENCLLFSDIPRNQIVRWSAADGISVFLNSSGYTGQSEFSGREPGTNGLMLDADGHLIMCCHGDRAICRLEPDQSRKVLADRYAGRRFNSPNDLVIHSNGDIYFTDPAYGLPKGFEDPAREVDWCGVYKLSPDGKVSLLTKEMTRPNGIGLSPDEKTLYVAQSDPTAAIWKAFPLREDGQLGPGRVLNDVTKWVGKRPGLPDGLVVDIAGNLWATGPGGVLVMDPKGKLLGILHTGQATANCTFGEDGSTLFITADMYLCRVRTKTVGVGFSK